MSFCFKASIAASELVPTDFRSLVLSLFLADLIDILRAACVFNMDNRMVRVRLRRDDRGEREAGGREGKKEKMEGIGEGGGGGGEVKEVRFGRGGGERGKDTMDRWEGVEGGEE
jgi:hypothetical protein